MLDYIVNGKRISDLEKNETVPLYFANKLKSLPRKEMVNIFFTTDISQKKFRCLTI